MPPLKVGECMIDKVLNTMREHNMLPTGSVLVGLSGGADSVALLNIMHNISQKYGFKVYAAHINHGLRGDTAQRDEDFSKSLCDTLGIECFVKKAKVRAIAEDKGISEEMAGRKVRYDFFAELMQKYDIEYTATAHHKNDNAETIVMNFMRGSSTSGLSGIPYKRDKYIRPLLDVSRVEIENYCDENGHEFVTDETNLETIYTRNKIRNVLIPEIEKEFNPNFVDTITSNADIIRDDEDFMVRTAREAYDRIVCDEKADIEQLSSLHVALKRRVIRMMIDKVCGTADVSSTVIDGVLGICKSAKTGAVCNITRGIDARIEYGKLVIGETQNDCEDFSYDIKIGESRYIPELGFSIHTEYADERKNDGAQYFEVSDDTEFISVTNRRTGDRFIPSGMNGTKSVKDYMINEKIPKSLRSRTGIVRIGDNIAWIIGYRRDERFKFHKKGIKITVTY